MALVTRWRVSSLTSGLILRTSDTVDFDTPASWAISTIVTVRAALFAPAILDLPILLLERSNTTGVVPLQAPFFVPSCWNVPNDVAEGAKYGAAAILAAE